jgi:hypothetical protein
MLKLLNLGVSNSPVNVIILGLDVDIGLIFEALSAGLIAVLRFLFFRRLSGWLKILAVRPLPSDSPVSAVPFGITLGLHLSSFIFLFLLPFVTNRLPVTGIF